MIENVPAKSSTRILRDVPARKTAGAAKSLALPSYGEIECSILDAAEDPGSTSPLLLVAG